VARYEGLLKEYPDFDDLDLVLLHMAECLHAQGRTAEALPHLGRLLEDFPESAQAETARTLMEEWSHEPPRPVPAATPPATGTPSPAPPLPTPPVSSPSETPAAAPSPLPSPPA
jgi:tetratricopeptide (TPR) repeat protein